MSQSLSKIYLHVIFHVKNTSPRVDTQHLQQLHSYIGGLIQTTGCHAICVGGTGDHIHALLELSRTETISHVAEEMKRNSSRWLKTISPAYDNFAWQSGYAALSVSQSQVNTVFNYIKNQPQHHAKLSFEEEYISFLKLYNIDYDKQYLFCD